MNEVKPIILEPIGYIESEYEDPSLTPRQGHEKEDSTARIVVRPKYIEGMQGLYEGMKITVVFNFNRFVDDQLVLTLQKSNKTVGVFSTRSPHRPNALGITVVKILDIADDTIHISNCDMLNGTPVVDIKPHMTVEK